MMHLELVLLGGFQVRASGRVIEVPGRKERALLALLALPPGERRSRDRLAGLLWGDRGDKQAGDSLRQAILRLRKTFDPVQPLSLLADRGYLTLDRATVSVDVQEFEQLTIEGTPQALARAVMLYRGDLLDGLDIDGAEFEEWLLVERQRLRDRAREALSALLASHLSSGERDQAGAVARRLLTLDPLQEVAHRALMKIYSEQGQVTMALKQYQLCRDALQAELGVRPEAETERLYQSIREKRAATRSAPAPAAVVPDPALTPPSAMQEAEIAAKPAIAVLPFVNMSGDPEQAYFSDGITEDIITELSRFHSLFVIASNSSFMFRSKSIKVQDIARELGVAYVVEGSVRRAANRVRITAQLVDASTGNHLWAERYDRDMHDIFALQDEVARSIASIVSSRVEAAGRDLAVRLSPAGLKAYDLLLRSKALNSKYTRTDNEQALACAERALELDPTSARAHSHIARCHFMNHMGCWTVDRENALAKAYEQAERAVVLDETDSYARCVLGLMHWFRREYDDARSEFEEAIDLNPNDPDARRSHGVFLTATGNPDAGIEQIDLGKRLNPFDTRLVPWIRGIACFTAHRYEEAIAALRQARDPINEVRGWLAASYAHAGRLQEARAMLEEFLRVAQSDMAVFPGCRLKDWESYWHGAIEYEDQKDFDHLFDALRKAGLPD